MKAILVDLDGTILDNTMKLLGAMREAYRALNIPYPGGEEIFKNFGRPLEWFVEQLKLSDSDQELFKATFHKVAHTEQQTSIHPEMYPVLKWFKDKRVAVVTSKSKKKLERIQNELSLKEYIRTYITSDDVVYQKPSPQPLLQAMEKLEVNNSADVCYIGDTVIDLQAAINAGMQAIGVGWSYAPNLLVNFSEKNKNTIVVRTGIELLEYLKDRIHD